MMRKWLFIGLTVVLAAALVALVVQGRRLEKKAAQSPRSVEQVRESAPSATRVLAPSDLEIVESGFTLRPGAGGKECVHRLVVRNRGNVGYASIMARFTYLAPGGKALGRRTARVNQPVPPGQATSLGEIVLEGIPDRAVACRAEIASADLEPGT